MACTCQRSRVFHLEKRISCKVDQIAEMDALATRVSSPLSDVKIQTSVDNHKTENIIVKIVEYQEELEKDIKTLIRIKGEIKKAIDTVNNNEQRLVLEMRYLLYMKWEEIAVKLGYSIEHIYRIHRAALNAVSILNAE